MMQYDLRDMDVVITHHGVKGQKWGVRRALTSTGHIVGSTYGKTKAAAKKGAQATGSAVSKGAKATGSAISKGTKATGRAIAKSVKESHEENMRRRDRGAKLEKKMSKAINVKYMSDEELRKNINRLNMENTLKRLADSKGDRKSKKLYKNRNRLDDSEIKKINDRLQLEDNLKQQLAAAKKNRGQLELGKHAMNIMGNTAADVLKQQLIPGKKSGIKTDSLIDIVSANAHKEVKNVIKDSKSPEYTKKAKNAINDKIWGIESKEAKKKYTVKKKDK